MVCIPSYPSVTSILSSIGVAIEQNTNLGPLFSFSDSGGPIFQYDREGIPVLLGIASFAYKCGLERIPTVYVRVSPFVFDFFPTEDIILTNTTDAFILPEDQRTDPIYVDDNKLSTTVIIIIIVAVAVVFLLTVVILAIYNIRRRNG